MNKITKSFLSIFIISFFFVNPIFSADEIQGSITEIDKNGTYIVVEGNKITTTKEMVEDALFEIGDKVLITVAKENNGLQAVSYKYIYDDEESE